MLPRYWRDEDEDGDSGCSPPTQLEITPKQLLKTAAVVEERALLLEYVH
jgi:hypothetical protein